MGGYKEYKVFDMLKRKGIIIKYAICIFFIFIMTIMFVTKMKKEVANVSDNVFIENSNLNYKVYLKENDFFDKTYVEEENQYIANLIDYIEANFKYELESTEQNIDYQYTYKIIAEVNVEDKENHKTLYKFDECLLDSKLSQVNDESKLTIEESIKVNFNRYNDIVKKFVNLYDLDNSISTLTINMHLNILNDERFDDTKKVTPAMTLTVPLAVETLSLDVESKELFDNTTTIYKNVHKNKYVFATTICSIVNIVLLINLIIFINDTRNEKAIYSMRLRKIMSNYGSYIQKLNNEFDFEEYQILEIKSFEDLLQIKETLNKPILMTEKALAMETYFFVPSDGSCYIYELKAGNLRKVKGKRYKTEETVEEKNKKRIEEINMKD